MGPPQRARVALVWSFAFAAAALLFARLSPPTRDPDSLLYARIAGQLSEREASRWIAPDWPAGAYQQGRFREHPVGIFLAPLALARLGYPAEQAAYAVNALYQILALLLLPCVAASFVPAAAARRLAWLLQLIPIAFAYRARANHEAAVLLCFLAALYATERSRESPLFALLTALSLDALMLVKGLIVAPALLCCAAWLAVRGLLERKPTAPAWWGLLGSCLVLLATAAAYDALYLRVTGDSFLDYYLRRSTRADPNPASAVSDTLYNVVWYGGRVLWMAAPWSVVWLLALRPGRRLPAPHGAPHEASAARAGSFFALSALLLYVFLFSLGGRRAERYIFPAYFVTGAAGALHAMRRYPRLERALRRWDSPYLPPIVWAATLALHLLGGLLPLPRLKFWNPDF